MVFNCAPALAELSVAVTATAGRRLDHCCARKRARIRLVIVRLSGAFAEHIGASKERSRRGAMRSA